MNGSIPACAGEPRCAATEPICWRVYPRVCGGTVSWIMAPVPASGLSPRVRGGTIPACISRRRSIPACAGEPWPARTATIMMPVYPRVCGGTPNGVGTFDVDKGLSPRVRGNPFAPRTGIGRPGSIPACAGEPHSIRATAMCSRVYPRVCGGTSLLTQLQQWYRGLSPRVRGNHFRVSGKGVHLRSIPACAGEPHARNNPWLPATVYPRVCGGTCLNGGCLKLSHGLSPRVRGNPLAN